MKNITIAGIQSQAQEVPLAEWQRFISDKERIIRVTIKETDSPFSVERSALSAEHDELCVCRMSDGSWLFESPLHLPPAQVLLSSDYKTIQYRLPECEDKEGQRTKLNHLLRTAFECRFCWEGIVSLHAACVEKDGFAVAFTGNSGMGKSTRAKAWVDGIGAEWISGDRPAVRLEKEGSTVCGVPWDGKEQIFRNVERPLLAILEVRRSPCNYIRRLTEEQALALLMRQVFIPMWDTDSAVMAYANVRSLIRKTPVYRVFCGPDEESAKAVYDILFHHPEKIREEANEMKIKEGFVLRNVVDEFIVMPTGDNIAKFDGAVVLNEVSAFVFEQLKHAVSRDDLLAAILNEYEVDEATAAADLDVLLKNFEEMGILEK